MSSRKKSRTWINSEESVKDADELLVFGYSCKMFRDEEKAIYIDEGKHLIPWMGDKSLLIDRYDGRGYLHNLEEFEPVEEKDAAENFSEEDFHLEQLLDEERYMALHKSLTEEELYHEEEMKRLRAALVDEGAYNQVGFSYEEQQLASNGQKEANNEEDEEQIDENKAFVALPELNVPEGMEVPPTTKVNAIIEKTAMFVSRQGPQMEIVIKAKQANNPQFAFLAFDHSLNPYYKHMVQAIKMGKYVPKPQTNASDEDDEDDSEDDHYLHPSLQASQAQSQILNVPKLSYTWTGKDTYSLLVSQLKDKVFSGIQDVQDRGYRTDNSVLPPPPPLPPVVPPTPVEPNTPPPPPPPPGIAPVTLPQQGGFDASEAAFPPADLLPIVDKMASYVAKNGIDFEAIVKSKGADERFEFLKPGHRFYTYYQYKRKLYEKQIQLEKEKEIRDKENKIDKVVSFSIKMKEGGEIRNALALGETDDGDGTNGIKIGPENGEQALEKLPETVENSEAVTTDPSNKLKTQSLEAKIAEERIRDKLAAAARERLVQVSREKQLQMERKRKAALFLTLLHKGKEEDANLIGPRLPNAAELEILVDTEAELPLIPSFLAAGTVAAALPQCPPLFAPTLPIMDPVTAAIQDKTVDALIRSHVSNSLMGASKPKASASHPHKSHRRRRSRSRSRSRSKSRQKSKRRSRSRSKSRERKNRKKSRRSRSKSNERRHRGHRRHSVKDEDVKSDRRKSRTPPAAYSSPKKSESPRHRSERSSKARTFSKKDERRSRSGSRHREDSSSPSATSKRRESCRSSSYSARRSKRTSSRSRSHSRHRSRSPRSSRSHSRSRDTKR